MDHPNGPGFGSGASWRWVARWAPLLLLGTALFLLFFPVDAFAQATGVELHDSFHEVRHALGIACH
jgi:hypothetical protein